MKFQLWMTSIAALGMTLSSAYAATEAKVVEQINRAADMAESTYGVSCAAKGIDYRGGRSLITESIYKYECKNSKGQVAIKIQAHVRSAPAGMIGPMSYQLTDLSFSHSTWQ